MNDPATCAHARRQLIAKDKEAEYIECLDCGAILEAEELPNPAASESKNKEVRGFNESLSDA